MKEKTILIVLILTILFISIMLSSFVKPQFVPALPQTTSITGKIIYYFIVQFFI
ncbi:MAG: hypothetical protein J7J93_03175 [Candidatus Aenigmarchaeota archaeon]|nr:hypothetical protein [Candidatus Aenigmarchaeota archaeon]